MVGEIITYGSIGTREDLENIITNIAPYETPFYSSMPKIKASNTYHEWLQDTLNASGDNAVVEDLSFGTTASNPRVRLGNYTQIFYKGVQVSYTQESVNKAGVASEMAYQTQLRLKELATDIEYALINGTGNSGASGTARRLKGLLAYITTNIISGTGTGDVNVLTESLLLDGLQRPWALGGKPTDVYANAFQKRQIDSFKLKSSRFVVTTTEVNEMVDVYQSSFGTVKCILDRYVPTDKVIILQKDLWAIAVLQNVTAEQLPISGLCYKKQMYGQLTLVARQEKGSSVITNLTTS
jgi:hypothetical protein